MIYFGEFEGYEGQAELVSEAVRKVRGLQKRVEIELYIVDSEEIRELNLESRGIDKATDVLSFPTLELFEKPFRLKDNKLDINPETGNLSLGTIIMCEEVMKAQAVEYGTGEREFSYLLAHGTLHLLGFDHMQEEEKSRMRAEEEKILAIALK
ncbi:MAG: rRNA maturation RNase YbeY [Bacillota bacterium]